MRILIVVKKRVLALFAILLCVVMVSNAVHGAYAELLPWAEVSNATLRADLTNRMLSGSVAFGGKYYVSGYDNNDGQALWEYNPAGSGTWTNLAVNAPWTIHSGVPDQFGFNNLIVYNNKLYVGVNDLTLDEVWTYDGTSWVQAPPVNPAAFRILNSGNFSIANGKLCLPVVYNPFDDGATYVFNHFWDEVYCLSGASWTGTGLHSAGVNADRNFNSFAAADNGDIYITAPGSSADTIWKYSAGVWTNLADTFFAAGSEILNLRVYDASLYVVHQSQTDPDIQVHRYDGSWHDETHTGIDADPLMFIEAPIRRLGGIMYLGVGYTAGVKIYAYDTATTSWTPVSTNGLGSNASPKMTALTSMDILNGQIYAPGYKYGALTGVSDPQVWAATAPAEEPVSQQDLPSLTTNLETTDGTNPGAPSTGLKMKSPVWTMVFIALGVVLVIRNARSGRKN